MAETETTRTDPAAPGAAPEGAVALRSGSPPAAAARDGEILPPAGVIAAPKRRKKRVVLPLLLAAALGGGGFEGYRYFVEGRFLVTTDDAYVKADMSTIAAKVAGYVSVVPVVDNAVVKKGQVLARIDDGDYVNAVEAARARIDTQDATVARIGRQVAAGAATVDQARAALASAKADATREAAEFDRADSLMRSSYGTQQRLDAARADRDRSAASVASAQASVTSAEAAIDVLKAQKVEAEKVRAELVTALARAERDLAFTTVKAPFDGVVGNKSVQPGQYVQTGGRLLSLVPLDSAYVEANFKETQVARLKPGQRVVIQPDAYGERAVEGRVESIAPASGAEFSMLPPENATGNFTKVVQRLPVRIAVPAEVAREGILRPGLSVEVEVHTRDASEPAPTVAGAIGPIVDGVTRRMKDAAASLGLGRAEAAQRHTAER
ncbi:HlyD family secretion protein [Lichenibacterium dinghuense]|uniref:HlyD family secretion protein n=1 Tax=Lichenibacterium dinghuense TaxID=2895977 RepID=UPI001F3E230E|nr:HlyD family secretion protein [Lichenibacterium sp. 6Y81]